MCGPSWYQWCEYLPYRTIVDKYIEVHKRGKYFVLVFMSPLSKSLNRMFVICIEVNFTSFEIEHARKIY